MKKSRKIRENCSKSKYMQMRGITLIALVITIIVLLILAGVTIVTLSGENGILTRANEAVERTNQTSDEEQRNLAIAEAAMNFENTEYKGITIPAGFAPTRIEGEDSVDDGLVIIDSEANEFVWIPVEDSNLYNSADQLSKSKSSENWPSFAYDTGENAKDGWINNPDPDNSDAMKNAKASVEKNGGFYVARYEAGVPTNAQFYVDKNSGNKTYAEEDEKKDVAKLSKKRNVTTTTGDEKGVDLKPISQKGKQVWNFIDQKNSLILSKNMYKESTSVNSYLIDSNAWNYICKYIFGNKEKIILTDSADYGNYFNNTKTNYEGIRGLFAKHINEQNIWTYALTYEYGNVPQGYAPRGNDSSLTNELELATGSSDDFKIYNIYDMAGNMWEWTAETVKNAENDYAVVRGGCFADIGVEWPVVLSRGGWRVQDVHVYNGFRCVLYLK